MSNELTPGAVVDAPRAAASGNAASGNAAEWLADRRERLIGTQQIIRGDLVSTGLVELFQKLPGAKSEGTLRIFNDWGERYLYFRSGTVQIFVPHRRSKRLGERLVHLGRLDPERLQLAIRLQQNDYKPLGRILLDNDFITQEQIDEVVEYQAAEDLYSLFTWKRGQFEFLEEDTTDPEMASTAGVDAELDAVREQEAERKLEAERELESEAERKLEAERELQLEAEGKLEAERKLEAEKELEVDHVKT